MKALRTENFRALYAEYGISPKTGCKWRDRLLRWGVEGLAEQSRRPHNHPEQLNPEVVCEMVRLKGLLNTNCRSGGSRKLLPPSLGDYGLVITEIVSAIGLSDSFRFAQV